MFDMAQTNDPTRITPTSASVIDLVLSSNKDKISLQYGISDHLPIFMTRKSVKGQFKKKVIMFQLGL